MTLIKLVKYILAIIFLILLFATIAIFKNSDNTSPAIAIPTDTPVPSPTVDVGNMVTQYYWYCWNTGNPSPHHLGYKTYGDHLCTNRELGR